jgi:hypothetical protein
MAALREIIVPEVAFRDAAMSDVVEFLAMCSAPVGEPVLRRYPDILQNVRVTQSELFASSDVRQQAAARRAGLKTQHT